VRALYRSRRPIVFRRSGYRRERLVAAVRYLKYEIDRPYKFLYDLTAIDERVRVHRDGSRQVISQWCTRCCPLSATNTCG
jgi:hypothetical protein